MTQIPRWAQVVRAKGVVEQEADRHGLLTRQVTGVPLSLMPSGQESPKGGVGFPTGFARGAGREWALPVAEVKRYLPETTPRFEGKKSPSRN